MWRPVIEIKRGREHVDHRDRQRFLTGQPDRLLREGKFAKVNILLGTSDELFASAISECLSPFVSLQLSHVQFLYRYFK